MSTNEINEKIARYMGTDRVEGIRVARLPDYANDLNALGEVLERIRQEYDCCITIRSITLKGRPSVWFCGIEIELAEIHQFGPTEKAAKVAAILEFIKMEGGAE